MNIIRFEGAALKALRTIIDSDPAYIRVGVDEGEVKLKAGEQMWTTGLAGAEIERRQ